MRRFRRRPGLSPRRLLRAFLFRSGRAMGSPRPVIRRLRRAHLFLQAGQQSEAAPRIIMKA